MVNEESNEKVATMEFDNMTNERLLAIKIALEGAGFDLESSSRDAAELFDNTR